MLHHSPSAEPKQGCYLPLGTQTVKAYDLGNEIGVIFTLDLLGQETVIFTWKNLH